MPGPAANIDECIEFTQECVTSKFAGTDGLMNGKAALDIWKDVFANFSPDILDEGTVRDWFVPTQAEIDRLDTLVQSFAPAGTFNSFVDAQPTFENVFRTCNAAKFAEMNSRISASQLSAVVTQWNAAWI